MLDTIDINKLSLEELNNEIKKLAPKINRELKGLATTKGKYAAKPIQEVELGYAQQVANEAISNVRYEIIDVNLHSGNTKYRLPIFSSKDVKSINAARSVLSALRRINKSAASIRKLTLSDVKRRKSFSERLGYDLTKEEYKMLTDLLSKQEQFVGGSEHILKIFEMYGNIQNIHNVDKSLLKDLIELEMNNTRTATKEAYDYLKILGYTDEEIKEGI